MNFGNGGYNAHMPNEFLVIEHVDHATGMGEDIIKSIGNKEQFKFTKTFTRTAGGVSPYEDERECERLFGTYSSSYNYNTNRSSSSSSSSSSANNRSDGNVNSKPAEDAVNEETVKYIVDTYDEYVKGIKEDVEKKCDIIEDIIKDKFREAGIDYSTFGVNIKKEFAEVFSKEIKF
jgi:hypothetical protein